MVWQDKGPAVEALLGEFAPRFVASSLVTGDRSAVVFELEPGVTLVAWVVGGAWCASLDLEQDDGGIESLGLEWSLVADDDGDEVATAGMLLALGAMWFRGELGADATADGAALAADLHEGIERLSAALLT
jgi:hypothetical protein